MTNETMPNINYSVWEADEYVICAPMPVGQTLHKADAQVVARWLPTAYRELTATARQEERKKILEKIEQYRCHPDEVHCTCMNALKDFIINQLN